MTAPQRLTGTPRACRVTPEEYRSTVLIASSWRMAKIRNGTTNQLANVCGIGSSAGPTVLVVTV